MCVSVIDWLFFLHNELFLNWKVTGVTLILSYDIISLNIDNVLV